MAGEMVRRAKSYVSDVEFSPMDATRSDVDYLCEMLAIAIDAGATTINIPDTVGYTVPDEYAKLMTSILKTGTRRRRYGHLGPIVTTTWVWP